MGKAITTGVLVALITFFSFYIGKFAYILGVLMGFINSGFSVLGVIGISCSLLNILSSLLLSFGLFIAITKVLRYFKI